MNHQAAPPLPYVARPKGVAFYFGTWTGRLIVINTVMFLVTSWLSSSLLMPSMSVLLALGAKDPVSLAHGEYWRLITPMFLHVGIVHYAVNNYVLQQIGYQLEALVGGLWFLAIYLLSGVAGNLASAIFSVNLSAGASTSLFGLLGLGLCLENAVARRYFESTGRKPGRRAYAATIAINLAIGLVIPFIDNSAHLGGLVGGFSAAWIMVRVRPNRLERPRKGLAIAVAIGLLTAAVGGAVYATSPAITLQRLIAASQDATSEDQRIYFGLQALRLAPHDPKVRQLIEDIAASLDKAGHRRDAARLRSGLDVERPGLELGD